MEMDVLVISMQGIGNSLLAVPMIKALKECFKNVHITVLVQKNGSEELLKNLDFIDEIIIYNKADSVYEKIHLILTLRNKKFGSILLTYPSSRKNVLLAKLIGANKIIGHTNDSGKNCYRSKCNCTNKIPVNENLHDLEQNFNLLKPLGIQPPKFDTSIKIPLSKNAEENVDILLKKNNITPSDIIIGIHPGSSDGFKEKRWQKEKFAKLIDMLILEMNAKAILFGGTNEIELSKDIENLCTKKFISVIGQLSLDETASLIKRCKLFISNDTGLMHIATTVETPVIAIFGPTDQKRTAPYGKGNLVIRKNLECSPCYKFHIRKFKCKFNSVKCLNNISVEEVISACRNFIKKSG